MAKFHCNLLLFSSHRHPADEATRGLIQLPRNIWCPDSWRGWTETSNAMEKAKSNSLASEKNMASLLTGCSSKPRKCTFQLVLDCQTIYLYTNKGSEAWQTERGNASHLGFLRQKKIWKGRKQEKDECFWPQTHTNRLLHVKINED